MSASLNPLQQFFKDLSLNPFLFPQAEYLHLFFASQLDNGKKMTDAKAVIYMNDLLAVQRPLKIAPMAEVF